MTVCQRLLLRSSAYFYQSFARVIPKNLKLLLPNRKSSDSSSPIYLLENGSIASDTSAILNDYFTTPTIDESVLTLSVNDFNSHTSVLEIQEKAPKLD